MVRIRLKRMGRRNRPFYRINAVEMRTQRDGKVLENLGWYDPVADDPEKQVSLHEERIKEWLGRGAQPSDTVNDILAKHELIDADAWRAVRESRYGKRKAAVTAQREAEAKAKAQDAARAKEEEAKAKAEAEAAAAAEAAGATSGDGNGDGAAGDDDSSTES